MIIKEVSYRDFRNIESARIEFSPGTNVLWGNNAQGKTNILEGIYFFARGRSFRAGAERELVRFGAPDASADIVFRRESDSRDTSLGVYVPASGKKRLTRNGVALTGVSEMIGDLCAVLFCPDHLSLVAGSPGARRSFLDIAIAQLSPIYIASLRRFNHALDQRNALIKSAAAGNTVRDAEWEAFASVMAECAAYVAAARYSYTGYLAKYVGRIFEEMTGERETPELYYKTHLLPSGESEAADTAEKSGESETAEIGTQSCESETSAVGEDTATSADEADADSSPLIRAGGSARSVCDVTADEAAKAHIMRLLTENTEREIRAGTTLYGIHKDDIAIKLNSLDARTYASQGQTRSLSLAMKLAEGEISRDVSGEYPVFLLDDVLSELDSERRTYILGALEGRQIIVTSCEPELYGKRGGCRFIEVEAGKIKGE